MKSLVRLTTSCWRKVKASRRRHRKLSIIIISVLICINIILMRTPKTVFLAQNRLERSSENVNKSGETRSRDTQPTKGIDQNIGSREGKIMNMTNVDVSRRCNLRSLLPVFEWHEGTFNKEHAERLSKRFRLDWNQELPGSDPRTPWNIASRWASSTHLYPEDAPDMGGVLRAMTTWDIKSVSHVQRGAGMKLLLWLEGGQKVLLKPQWYSRHRVFHNTLCTMKDTHNGEIAAFHISRILGFRNVPLAAGRKIDIRSLPFNSSKRIKSIRVFRSLFKTKRQPIEAAILLWTPDHVTFEQSEHPWGGVCKVRDGRFNYSLPGATDPVSVCRATQEWAPFRTNHPGLFLDLVDASILQYLTLNADRKMYLGTGKFSAFLPTLDNARSFGRPDKDVIEILAPLTDCCRVRESTYRRLLELENGTLSHVLDDVTREDPLHPLLSPANLRALDRRLHQTVAHIRHCICKMGQEAVLIRDTS